MKKNYIVSPVIVTAMLVVLLSACKDRAARKETDHAGGHKEWLVDSSLLHQIQSVNEQAVTSISPAAPVKGTGVQTVAVAGTVTYDTRNQTSIASRVAGRIERLMIKYNYQPVKKGQLIMEVYSSDLAAAQRELLLIVNTNNTDEMLNRAKQRLLLLGMQPAQIQQVINTGKVLYRVPVYSNASGYILETSTVSASPANTAPMPASTASGGDGMGDMGGGTAATSSVTTNTNTTTPVLLREGQYVSAGQSLFTIYQTNTLVAEFSFPPAIAASIKQGQQIQFYRNRHSADTLTGTIGLIQPVFRNGEYFTRAKLYVNNNTLLVGELLTAVVSVPYLIKDNKPVYEDN